MRTKTAKMIAPILKASGFRFSKSYRNGKTAFHRFVYRNIDVVLSNILADME